MFNGKNLEGWTGVPPSEELKAAMLRPAGFIDRGELHAHRTIGGALLTVASYQDFVLTLEYRIPVGAVTNTHSSVSLVKINGSAPVEVNGVKASGNISYVVTPGKTGDLQVGGRLSPDPMLIKRRQDAEEPIGSWNEIEIRSSGMNLTFFLNGRIVNQARTNELRPYHIGFAGWNSSSVHYRNIRLRRLLNTDSDPSRDTESQR